MKVSGFTFIRNGVQYDYPFVESIKSLLPLVDELIVLCGNSEDDTVNRLESIADAKIKIIHSTWNEQLRDGGRVLAVETDKALQACSSDSHWLIYLQGDEVIHENDYDTIREAMLDALPRQDVEGLLFDYKHFYGSYKYIGDGRRWYTHEVRIIRNNKAIQSYKDAQGFRLHNKKLHVRAIPASIYHYGWVKHPTFQQAKQNDFHKWWSSDKDYEQKNKPQTFSYEYHIDSLELFTGTHPMAMISRVAAENWPTNLSQYKKKFRNVKAWLYYYVAKYTGLRPFAYKNYKRLSHY